jgi:hypothetical protein
MYYSDEKLNIAMTINIKEKRKLVKKYHRKTFSTVGEYGTPPNQKLLYKLHKEQNRVPKSRIDIPYKN